MSVNISLKNMLLTLATAIAFLIFAATPARAQTELLSPSGAPYALVVAGMGFIVGYSVAPHLGRVWMNKQRKGNR